MNFRGIDVVVDNRISLTVDRDKYPFMYGMRHADNDWSVPVTIEERVVVNRYGFMFASKELPLSNKGYINVTRKEGMEIDDEVCR